MYIKSYLLSMSAYRLKNNLVRDPSLPKGRQLNDIAAREVREVLGTLEFRRDLLIEALHLVQDYYRCLTSWHLMAIADLFKISQAEVYEVASFYHHFDIVHDGDTPPPDLTIRICDGLSCQLAGVQPIISTLVKDIDQTKVRVQTVPCIGRCASAPVAQLGKRALDYISVSKVKRALNGKTIPEIPRYKNLSQYLNEGGYQSLKDVIAGKFGLASALSVLTESGLRGMGGAGFQRQKNGKS